MKQTKYTSGSILIIEDSTLITKTLRRELHKYNYHVEEASTLIDASDILSAQTFDLIILDLNLPDGEGEQILDALSVHQKLNIIVYTTDVDKQRRNEWFRYGVLGYLSKADPFSFVVNEIHKTMQAQKENTFYTVLVIDDSTFICRQISTLLQTRNYTVVTAHNGHDAQKFLSHNVPDLIILDLELPDTQGEVILQNIRRKKSISEIPVFILTGTYNSEIISTLIKQGANEFFTKPFVAEELLLKIDFWIDLKRQLKLNSYQQKLLQEYKEAVDRSTIVSKTNKKGIITYANEAFCTMSGYSKDELIGSSHSLVRHPDMPKETFAELWKSILSGTPWRGTVKNLRKDKSAYWVNAIVSPIRGVDDEIEEFISIRTDISDIQEIRENLKNQLKITEENFEDAYHLSRQYEKAINESSIVTRTDLEGVITYANQYFYDITGYEEAEIVGQKHSIIKHPDTPRHVFETLWKSIKAGNIWRGVLKNSKKDGSPYWVATTILPIKDKQGIIVEYMSIRHEITEIIQLHEEIEATQQEIIYTMGELGECRNQETGHHVRRVAEYSKILALKSGLDEADASMIAAASPMHDIGKVGIPDAILLKPAALDQDEWCIMQTHAMLGFNILSHSQRPLLKAAAIIAKEHHEKWNGSGYPEGLAGEKIHPYARIVAIADIFDALGHSRPYKKAWSDKKILDFFQEEAGKQFDPFLVQIFIDSFDTFVAIREALKS